MSGHLASNVTKVPSLVIVLIWNWCSGEFDWGKQVIIRILGKIWKQSHIFLLDGT
jgi:hypothetical protein